VDRVIAVDALTAARTLGLRPEADPRQDGLWRANCPLCVAHSEHALQIREGVRGAHVTVHCKTGCEPIEIVRRLEAAGPEAAGPGPRRGLLSDASCRQLVSARSFVLDAPDHVPAIFGRDREVIWSQGEGLLIVGPQGVGKTTLMQQLAIRRAAVLDGDLIGYPVKADTERLTLYLALDRPQQIARSFKRMVTNAQEQRLGRLIVWKGPLPFNIVKAPETFVLFVQEVGEIIGTPIGTVCTDSLKDMAAPLSSEEVGAALNRAIGGVIAQEIEFTGSHHQRKATSENRKPTSLADVYGSGWITAGMGSVALLWGEAGDPIVEMTHLKQPAEEVGPLELAHDHERGVTTRRDRLDAWTILQGATRGGVAAPTAAEAIYGIKPSKAQIEKVRRRFERFVSDE
jgi:replicative DNA helicase